MNNLNIVVYGIDIPLLFFGNKLSVLYDFMLLIRFPRHVDVPYILSEGCSRYLHNSKYRVKKVAYSSGRGQTVWRCTVWFTPLITQLPRSTVNNAGSGKDGRFPVPYQFGSRKWNRAKCEHKIWTFPVYVETYFRNWNVLISKPYPLQNNNFSSKFNVLYFIFFIHIFYLFIQGVERIFLMLKKH